LNILFANAGVSRSVNLRLYVYDIDDMTPYISYMLSCNPYTYV